MALDIQTNLSSLQAQINISKNSAACSPAFKSCPAAIVSIPQLMMLRAWLSARVCKPKFAPIP